MKENRNGSNSEERQPLLNSKSFNSTSSNSSDSSISIFTMDENNAWEIEYNFLKNYTQKAINNIKIVIENINLFNTELDKFKENQNNGNVKNLLIARL